jgi:hypothetical protein
MRHEVLAASAFLLACPAAQAVVLSHGDLLTGAGTSVVRVVPYAVVATLGSPVTDVAVEADGRLVATTWDVSTLDVGLHRIDPGTGTTTALRTLSGDYPAVAVEPQGNLLVFVGTDLYRLDPTTGATLAQVSVCPQPAPLGLGAGDGVAVNRLGEVFVATPRCPRVQKVDLATGAVTPVGDGSLLLYPLDVVVASDTALGAAFYFGALFLAEVDLTAGTESFVPTSGLGIRGWLAFDPLDPSTLFVNALVSETPPTEQILALDLGAAQTLTIAQSVGGATAPAGITVVLPVCSDRLDNDGDGAVDAPDDPDCTGPEWHDEGSPELLALTQDGRLLALDPHSGAGIVLGATGLQNAMALERSAAGPLYAVARGNELHRIDPSTYAPTLVGAIGSYPLVSALALSADGSVLYAAASADGDGRAERLVQIDPASATATEIGLFGAGYQDVHALALSPSGTLYAFHPTDRSPELYGIPAAFGVVDPATGAVTSSTSLGGDPIGADFDPSGRLYATDFSPVAPSQLVRIDPATGSATVLGSIGLGPVTGLAATSPTGDDPDCADGVDNDGDGRVDAAADPGCAGAGDLSEKAPGVACDDGADNDGDGYIDYPSDPGCWLPTFPFEKPQCQDGIDNDGQPGTDFDGGQSIHGACSGGSCPAGVNDPEADGVPNPDPQCKAWHNQEQSSSCGLGFELAVLLPLLARLRGRAARRSR